LSQQEVADRVGRQRATIANTLRLLSLSPPVQDLVRAGSLSMGHARALASLAAPSDQQQIAARCVKEGLSVRQVESLVAALARGARTPAKRTPATDPNVIAAEENLQRALRTKVRIVRGRKAGRIELHYFSEEELQRLYDLLLESSRRKV
jgi:ParB family chromosome partitioning protein